MNQEPSLQLPESTCAYERYDPVTLEPKNPETFIRLQELGWSEDDFKGQSVLDIGCNSGLLTIQALKLGASHVHACDVQPPLVEFVRRVVAARRLPVTVEQIAFHKLEPVKHEADVVLFMEVLHWAVSQGLELRSVIQKLAQLTRGMLYIEFPWSVKEPSIQKQTKLTEETYSADAALDELTRYFTHVRVVRFMRYFGFGSKSQRVLIEARGKRPEAEVLARLPDVYSLDVALSRGRNESYLLTSAKGCLVTKRLASESLLHRLPEELCTALFENLRSQNPRTIVFPEKFGGSYLFSDGSNRWLIFPFIGRLPSVGRPTAPPINPDELIDLFIHVRRDLRVSSNLMDELRNRKLFIRPSHLAKDAGLWPNDVPEPDVFETEIKNVLRELQNLVDDSYDGLCHGDLQTGNFVYDNHGQIRVVDLDNLCLAPIYSDGLMGLMWRGFDQTILARFCERLGREERRSVARTDVAVAIARGVAWISAVRPRESEPVLAGQILRLKAGLKEALLFHANLAEGS